LGKSAYFTDLMHPARPISRYGIHLRPITEADLEQVRLWRNADHVRSKMEFQAEISPEMQQAWWAGLDPQCNHYYIIAHSGREIGVIHAKDIDWQARTAETGIFVGEVDFLDTFVPVLAVLALMDALFEGSELQTLRAKVKAGDLQILEFNRRLGYQTTLEKAGFLMLEVGQARYHQQTAALRAMAGRLG
jgi:RimJ/RimL family protein N-acetyltransferase